MTLEFSPLSPCLRPLSSPSFALLSPCECSFPVPSSLGQQAHVYPAPLAVWWRMFIIVLYCSIGGFSFLVKAEIQVTWDSCIPTLSHKHNREMPMTRKLFLKPPCFSLIFSAILARHNGNTPLPPTLPSTSFYWLSASFIQFSQPRTFAQLLRAKQLLNTRHKYEPEWLNHTLSFFPLKKKLHLS